MIKIQKFECNMFQENCYVASDETKECVIIDCGAFYQEERKAITDYINGNGLTPKHLLCTHGHIDHNFGDNMILECFGLYPEVNKRDEVLMENMAAQAQTFIGLAYNEKTPEIKDYLTDNGIVKFGNHSFTIIPTPGHTPGSVMLYCKEEKVVFSGDTLFKLSIGRTDFDLGCYNDIIESLKNIVKILPPDTTVLPGHGEKTSIRFEEKHNPYMK